MKKTKKMVVLGLLVAAALIIHVIEAQLPVLLPGAYGVKLGLANIISLFALLLFGWKEALTIVILRTTLGSIFGGSVSTFMFSFVGGILSNAVMILLYKFFKESLSVSVISICGAIFHNIGQLFVAAVVIKHFGIYVYLPVLLISGVVTGYFIGLATKFLHKHMQLLHIFDE